MAKLSFERNPPVELVSIDSLKVDPNKFIDRNLVELYAKWLVGKSDAIFTRVPIEEIDNGVFILGPDGKYAVHDRDYGADRVDEVANSIRVGLRHTLLLYRARPGQSAKRFICSDDSVIFQAYEKLGISEVPAQIVGAYEIGDLTRSGYLVRNAQKKQNGVFRLVHVEPKLVATILGDRLDEARFEEMIAELEASAQHACDAIGKFHLNPSRPAAHYHETLHASAFRCLEALRAIRLLWRDDMVRQAYPLVRSLYEMMLNFSLDWLAPDRIGAMLHTYAQLRRGISQAEFSALKKTIRPPGGYIFQLFENVAEKSKASPIGADPHKSIYADLSAETHQDYAVTEAYATTLKGGAPTPLSAEDLRILLRQLDLIVAASLHFVRNDVGSESKREEGG